MGVLPILPLLLTIVPQIIARRDQDYDVKAVVEGNRLFSQKLYEQLALKAEPEDNIFYSPVGVHDALSMTYQGAEGATRDAFSKVLGVKDHRIAATGYQDIMVTLKSCCVTLANAVFLRSDLKLNDAFLTTTRDYFASHVQSINFTPDVTAAATMNKWVKEKTRNKIENIIETTDFKNDTLFVLISAICFQERWRHKFHENLTKTEKFYLNDNDTVNVEMMRQTRGFNYKEDADLHAKVLEIPYANEHLSLVIVLPNKRDGIADLEKKLATYDLTKITDGMKMPEVEVQLPKFKIKTKMILNQFLSKMGLEIAFTEKANFSIISGYGSIKIDRAIQTAFMEVNEKGAVAAAATGISGSSARLRPAEKQFKVDHPFMMFLLFKSGPSTYAKFKGPLPLFVGKIMNAEMRLSKFVD